MTPHFTKLDRLSYFIAGSILMALKYNLDRFIAWNGFHRSWYFWNYIRPHGYAAIDAIPPEDARFYIVLIASSLPFLTIGILLTLARLRSTGLPLLWCLLFFAPVINLIFFLALCVIPPSKSSEVSREDMAWRDWLPQSTTGSALVAVFIVGSIGAALATLSTRLLENYGSALFVSLPFAMGLVAVLLHSAREPRDFFSSLLVAMLPTVLCGVFLLALAVEGAVCLIMAAPIALALALLGGLIGISIVGSRKAPLPPLPMLAILAGVPFLMGMEDQAKPEPPLLEVTSSLIINASPERVWPNVVSFSRITEKRDWLLRTGVAYPTQARIDGTGVGAVRHCIFSTGEFVEPIQVWDENRLLRFSVAAQPEPLEELTPYPHLKTPHLEGYFESRQGELRLEPLPGGKTLLQGTTWYTDRIWPSFYWRFWSDLVIHHIHLRVLNHIKNCSENP